MRDNRLTEKIIRKVILFFCVMLSVVVAGIFGMWIYEKNVKHEDLKVYELFKLPTFSFAESAEEKMMEENEEVNNRILEEALASGQKAKIIECTEQDKVRILFAGDVLLDDNYAMMSSFHNRGGNIEEAFSQDLIDRMRSADIFMLNNEFTYTNRGMATPGKKFTFRANPDNVNFLKEIGTDIVSVANNHIYDFGEVSLLDTLDTLENADIDYVGAGRNLDDAMTPVYYIADGFKIAFISATQIERTSVPDTKEATAQSAGVLRCMDTANLLNVIGEAKANSDFVILYIHWGTESQAEIDWLQKEQAPVYAQAGVDLIIGDHPHCLQKIENVSGVPTIFSMGNYWFNSKTQNTCLVEVTLSKGKMESFQFIPCLQSDCRTKLLTGDEKMRVIEYMRGLSPNVVIDDEGFVTF